jgi:hypothetical protein
VVITVIAIALLNSVADVLRVLIDPRVRLT